MESTAGMFGNPATEKPLHGGYPSIATKPEWQTEAERKLAEQPSGPVWGEWGAPVTVPGAYWMQFRHGKPGEFSFETWTEREIELIEDWSVHARRLFICDFPDSISEPPAPEPLPPIIEVEHLVGRHPVHGVASAIWIKTTREVVLLRPGYKQITIDYRKALEHFNWTFEPRPSE